MALFAVNSTSVITAPIKRAAKVLQRAKISKLISYAGVFNCRKISSSVSWSQHAWGNAIDLFPKGSTTVAKKENCKRIANAVVTQATKKTTANRGRKLKIYRVIDHENRRMWIRGSGWGSYSGSAGLHVHAEGPTKYGSPPCA